MSLNREARRIVKRLRRKLGDDPGSPTYILTEPSVGYQMEEGEGPETGGVIGNLLFIPWPSLQRLHAALWTRALLVGSSS